MYEVIGVCLQNNQRVYYFSPNSIDVKKGDNVIVETEKGLQYGKITTEKKELDGKKLNLPLKNILRIATKEDEIQQSENEKKSNIALENAKKIAKKLNLEMKFINCGYTFDKNQLIFNFIADDRVDFRELAKKLASIYKTRIELRQIGVRDKAKEIGGIGPCGRFLCCSTFLSDFNSVSINMAKNQNLSLNPTKINGICGRLLCCLKYEDDEYTEMKKDFPQIGEKVQKDGIEGKVSSVNLLKNTYVIEKEDKTTTEIYNDKVEK